MFTHALTLANPAYTFSTFIPNEKERTAFNAALAVAEEAAEAANPLVLYGRTGSGKSHMLHAIANEMRRRRPDKHVLQLPARAFIDCMIDAYRHEQFPAFRDAVSTADAVLIDDMYCLADRERTREELFLILQEAAARGVQIVVACDSCRVAAGLAGSFAVELPYPDEAARREITRRCAEQRRIVLAESSVRHIARRMTGSSRRLQSVMARIAAQMMISPNSIGLHDVKTLVARSRANVA